MRRRPLAQYLRFLLVCPELLQRPKEDLDVPGQAGGGKAGPDYRGRATAADPPVGHMFQPNLKHFDGFNRVYSENPTLLFPAAFYAASLIGRDSYLKRTGLLAAEAWVDADLTSIAFRSAMRRTRPDQVPPGGSFSDTWFQTGAHPLKSAGSFPSGHMAWSFAVATVIARRHGKNHKWVPFLAYGLAAVGGASRLSSQQHYLSDVFVGGVLGYSIGRFVVLRQ